MHCCTAPDHLRLALQLQAAPRAYWHGKCIFFSIPEFKSLSRSIVEETEALT